VQQLHHSYSPLLKTRLGPTGVFTLSQAYASRSFASSATSGSANNPDDSSAAASVFETVKGGVDKVQQGAGELWASLPPSVHEVLNPSNPYFVVSAYCNCLSSLLLETENYMKNTCKATCLFCTAVWILMRAGPASAPHSTVRGWNELTCSKFWAFMICTLLFVFLSRNQIIIWEAARAEV
jgi:hypothetical protein